MKRRGFMASMLALGMAPAIVRAESLMRVRPIVLPGDAEYGAIGRMIGNFDNADAAVRGTFKSTYSRVFSGTLFVNGVAVGLVNDVVWRAP